MMTRELPVWRSLMYVPVNVVLSETSGNRVANGPPWIVSSGSVTMTLVRVTLPLFVTVKA